MLSSPLRKYNIEPSYHYKLVRTQLYEEQTKKVKKRKPFLNVIKRFIFAVFALILLSAYGYYICPYNYHNYFKPLYLNRFLNKDITFDIENYIHPTRNYLNNSYFMDKFLFVEKPDYTKEFTDIKIVSQMEETKNKLINLFSKYPKLSPSVFLFEYSTGGGLEINSDTAYPSASIIKIPIAFELIRLIDKSSTSQNPISLSDEMTFDEFFRTSGSGKLQFTTANINYTIDYLANIMIANSDNSATNMLLYKIGGMDGFNRAMRNIGLKVTSMHNWLADLDGTNKITAREVSRMLYNLENPNYINPKYKNVLKEYLGNTKNTHLIKEKLPQDVMVLHKTGDIGTMLGDSAIIYTDNGKKYILTILVKRPFNDYTAKTLIQDASLLIYNDIKQLR